jgi:hypothetical protein
MTISRRSFLKTCGAAAIAPTALAGTGAAVPLVLNETQAMIAGELGAKMSFIDGTVWRYCKFIGDQPGRTGQLMMQDVDVEDIYIDP